MTLDLQSKGRGFGSWSGRHTFRWVTLCAQVGPKPNHHGI